MILSFDISEERSLNLFEAAELREEISLKLDSALQQAGLGKWVGGSGSEGMMRILIQVEGYEAASYLITSALEGHWLSERLKISRHGHPEKNTGSSPSLNMR